MDKDGKGGAEYYDLIEAGIKGDEKKKKKKKKKKSGRMKRTTKKMKAASSSVASCPKRPHVGLLLLAAPANCARANHTNNFAGGEGRERQQK